MLFSYEFGDSDIQLLLKPFLCCRPSTFAQAAKLKRLAAAKEKELAKSKC